MIRAKKRDITDIDSDDGSSGGTYHNVTHDDYNYTYNNTVTHNADGTTTSTTSSGNNVTGTNVGNSTGWRSWSQWSSGCGSGSGGSSSSSSSWSADWSDSYSESVNYPGFYGGAYYGSGGASGGGHSGGPFGYIGDAFNGGSASGFGYGLSGMSGASGGMPMVLAEDGDAMIKAEMQAVDMAMTTLGQEATELASSMEGRNSRFVAIAHKTPVAVNDESIFVNDSQPAGADEVPLMASAAAGAGGGAEAPDPPGNAANPPPAKDPRNVGDSGNFIKNMFDFLKAAINSFIKPTSAPKNAAKAAKALKDAAGEVDKAEKRGLKSRDDLYRMSFPEGKAPPPGTFKPHGPLTDLKNR